MDRTVEFVDDASAGAETSLRELAMRITAVQVPTPEWFAVVRMRMQKIEARSDTCQGLARRNGATRARLKDGQNGEHRMEALMQPSFDSPQKRLKVLPLSWRDGLDINIRQTKIAWGCHPRRATLKLGHLAGGMSADGPMLGRQEAQISEEA